MGSSQRTAGCYSYVPAVVGRREAGSGQLASDGGNLDEEDEWASESNSEARAWCPLTDGPFKLVLIVNMELKMGKGKVRRRGAIYFMQMPCPAQKRYQNTVLSVMTVLVGYVYT